VPPNVCRDDSETSSTYNILGQNDGFVPLSCQSLSMPLTRLRVAWLVAPLLLMTGCGFLAKPVGPSTAQQQLARADSFRVSPIAKGVQHLYAWEAAGPWAIHVLEVLPSCKPVWEARKAGPALSGRATTTVLGQGAIAAINADFFALPAGTPVGVHVAGSEVLIGPAERPVAVGFAGSAAWIDVTRLDATLTRSGSSAPIVQINRPRPATAPVGIRLFTHWFGSGAPADTQAITARIRTIASGRGVVELVDSTGNAIWLDTTHVVLHLPRGSSINVDDSVSWRVQVRPAAGGAPAQEALGGFPWLVQAGQSVLALQLNVRPEFGEQRHPRSAIGFGQDGRAFLVVVDGRQAPYSDGMNLKELTDLMLSLGAYHALNLDGGGSTALVIRGRAVNRPSDREGERAVGNALALVRCR
jgi:hypothetical protein